MKFIHIPEVMATGFFLENKICRIHEFEENGITYAIQYVCKSKVELDNNIEEENEVIIIAVVTKTIII